MPTESKKKKSKKDEKKVEKKVEKKDEKKASSLLIKSEPIELKSLEHYVDDRVELIRQIFDSLKTKTIESIIPDFLQVKSIKYTLSKMICFKLIEILKILLFNVGQTNGRDSRALPRGSARNFKETISINYQCNKVSHRHRIV